MFWLLLGVGILIGRSECCVSVWLFGEVGLLTGLVV